MSVASAKTKKVPPRRSGRPTKEQAEGISDHIVEVATRLFSETSFEATSVDLIAAKARISKQTFYARFDSKEALFAAVVRRSMSDLLAPPAGEPDRSGPIEATLIRIGAELLRRATTPAAAAMDRLIASEAYQFRQLAVTYRESAVHMRGLMAEIFSQAMRDRQIRAANANFLAQQFLYAVVDGPARAQSRSDKSARSEKELRDQVAASVKLFLDGCRDSSAETT